MLEPWGEELANWRAGMIASTIVNVNRKKGKPPFKPQDFMPKIAFEYKKPEPVNRLKFKLEILRKQLLSQRRLNKTDSSIQEAIRIERESIT